MVARPYRLSRFARCRFCKSNSGLAKLSFLCVIGRVAVPGLHEIPSPRWCARVHKPNETMHKSPVQMESK